MLPAGLRKRSQVTKEINLLQIYLQESESERKVKKLIKILSPIVLLVFVLIVIGVYSFSVIQSAQANSLNSKISNVLNTIQSQSQTESYYQGIKLKLNLVKEIFSDQIDYAEVTEQLQKISPPDITFSNLTISSDKKIDVTYKAQNSDIVKELINSLLDPNMGGKYYDQIMLKSLVYNREGWYIIALSFQLK